MSLTIPSPDWGTEEAFASSETQEQRESELRGTFAAAHGSERLWILDPGLLSPAGHHFSHDVALTLAARRANIPVLVMGFREIDERVWRGLPVLRHFHVHPYGKPDIHATAEQDFATLNEMFLHDLLHLPMDISSRDVVLFPTVTQNQMLGIAAWMTQLLAKGQCPRVKIGLMFGPTWSSVFDEVPEQLDLYRRAFAAWPPRVRHRVSFLCESEALATVYRQMTDRPVCVAGVPTVSVFQTIPTVPPQYDVQQFRVGYLGHARKEKGVHFLPDIARYTKITAPHIHFQVQLNYTAEGPCEHAARIGLEPLSNVAPLTLGPLDEEAYAQFLDACHLVLMPYCPKRYQARGSGLIHEAIQRGRPVVVPAGTELGAFVARTGIGTCFDVYQPASIAHAIQRLTRDYATYVDAVQQQRRQRDPIREANEYLERLRSNPE